MGTIVFSVFTKPWPSLDAPALAAHVRGLGFEAIEFPVRPGYPVQPENIVTGLPAFARALGGAGVRIGSIAGPTTEAAFAACAEAGIPLIRVMFGVGRDGYRAAEAEAIRALSALVPLARRHGVRVGVQNHIGDCPPNALGLARLVERFDPSCIGAIWDAGHNALCGEEPEHGLDVVWQHLALVNLKNALWVRANGPEAEAARWRLHWTSGSQGLASWPKVATALVRRGYAGGICLTAEYSAHEEVDRLIAADLTYARAAFATAAGPSGP